MPALGAGQVEGSSLHRTQDRAGPRPALCPEAGRGSPQPFYRPRSTPSLLSARRRRHAHGSGHARRPDSQWEAAARRRGGSAPHCPRLEGAHPPEGAAPTAKPRWAPHGPAASCTERHRPPFAPPRRPGPALSLTRSRGRQPAPSGRRRRAATRGKAGAAAVSPRPRSSCALSGRPQRSPRRAGRGRDGSRSRAGAGARRGRRETQSRAGAPAGHRPGALVEHRQGPARHGRPVLPAPASGRARGAPL